MHHFFLSLPSGEVRPLSAPYLPRMGDTLSIDEMEITITKVTWISNGSTFADAPILDGTPTVDHAVYVDHTAGTDHYALAVNIAARNGPGSLIPAIKGFRAATGVGLKEAKDMMDKVYINLGWRQ